MLMNCFPLVIRQLKVSETRHNNRQPLAQDNTALDSSASRRH